MGLKDSARKVVGACPLDCPDGCAWEVTLEGNAATDLKGRADHPLTRGALCVKVNHFLEHTQSDDRVLYPMRRIGPKGSGRFERIGWDDALTEISDRLKDVITDFGGEAIWPYQGTGTLGYLQGIQGQAGRRLWNALGASRHNMTICSIAGLEGLEYVIGAPRGIDPESLEHAKLILLWGTNTLTSGHHQWHFIKKARKQGAFVVVIDPVRTRTAELADQHIALLPGTDSALAMGILNVIVSLGAENAAYMEKHTLGWDALRDRVLDYTPEYVAELTGIDVETIIDLGTRVARTRPTAIRAAQGVQRHAGGGMTLRALASIPGVTGDWALPGGGLVYSTDGYFGANLEGLWRDDLSKQPVRTLSMTRLGEGLLDTVDPQVMALIIYAANPLVSSPQQDKIRRGLARTDLFTVVMEHFMTDTADYADIVLPATMQTEHADLHDGYGHLYIAWNEPAVEAPGECLSTTETFRQLARYMGLSEPHLFDSDETLARQLLTSDDPSLNGIDLETLKKNGWMRLNYPQPFVPYRDHFPTPSGKLEFLSGRAEADGHHALVGYGPAREQADPRLMKDYPFMLVTGASHYLVNSIFANHPVLKARAGHPKVLVNDQDAIARGIEDGQQLRVHNARGSFTAAAEVTDKVNKGILFCSKGLWLKLTKTTSSINATVEERDADLGGGAVFGDNRVNIEFV